MNEQFDPGKIEAEASGWRYSARVRRHLPTRPALVYILAISSRVVLGIALLACVLALVHMFFHFIGRAPYIAVDDSLGNVAVNLSAHGRYGFPASPIQGFSRELRLDSFMNYGPWPFAIGALLDWLFGTSYAIQRSVHLLGFLVTNLAFFLLLRRISLAAVGVFLLATVTLFWQAEWPMMRPDFAVAMFGALAIAAATVALRSDHRKAWFACGFCAASAATTHPIAFSFVPWAGMIWAVSPLVIRPGSATTIQEPVLHPAGRFIWIAAGGLLGVLMFLAAIKFEIGQLIALWSAGASFLSTTAPEPFYVTISRHFGVAWPLPYPTYYLLMIGFVAAAAFAALSLVFRFARRRAVLALVLPPVLLSIMYQISVGTYGNFHSGYALLSHTSTAWAIGAAVGASTIVKMPLKRFTGVLWEAGCRLAVSALLLTLTVTLILHPGHWSAVAKTQVDIGDYQHQVIGLLPPGASAWGGIGFGLESGKRINLLQFGDGAMLAAEFKPQDREAVSPEFLVLDNTLLRDVTFGIVQARSAGKDQQSPLDPAFTLFPHLRYHPFALVNAVPYGTTRVYGRLTRAAVTEHPLVAVNDGASPQWAKLTGAPLDISVRSTEPATFRLSFIGTFEARADRTRALQLPPGNYLITATIKNGATDHVGLLLATSTPHFVGEAGDIGYKMAQGPYFPYEQTVSLIVNHPGGALYVSQFDSNPNADFSITDVRPIEYIEAAHPELPMPALQKWRLVGGSGKVTMLSDARADVVGNSLPVSYQFASPPIPVPTGSTLRFSSELALKSGKVAIGLLDEHGAWLASPELGRPTFDFQTGRNKAVTVLVNGMDREPLKQPVEFTIAHPKIFVLAPQIDYQHRLAACREKANPIPSFCMSRR